MDRSDVLNLLTVAHTTNESGTQVTTITRARPVFCSLSSVSMKESYTAQSIGHNPELRASIAESADYTGEVYAFYNDAVYKVLRTYQSGLSVELTLERTRDLEGLI